VKHGLSRKLGTGTIRIDAVLDDGCLALTVGDDGLGMPRPALERVYDRGVGTGRRTCRISAAPRAAVPRSVYVSPSSRSVSPRDGWLRSGR
jgi:hypothetical protein